MIIIDGVQHKATWLRGMEQTADILNGENSGRLQGSLKMHLEYKGTFFNHKGVLCRDADCSDEEWDSLYLTLANPVNTHKGIFPFGTEQVLEQEVYISQVLRKPKRIEFIGGKQVNHWERTIAVTFTAIAPAWLPNGQPKGVK